jgi:hypothetical protein
MLTVNLESEDVIEGVTAFAQKRKAEWKGGSSGGYMSSAPGKLFGSMIILGGDRTQSADTAFAFHTPS